MDTYRSSYQISHRKEKFRMKKFDRTDLTQGTLVKRSSISPNMPLKPISPNIPLKQEQGIATLKFTTLVETDVVHLILSHLPSASISDSHFTRLLDAYMVEQIHQVVEQTDQLRI